MEGVSDQLLIQSSAVSATLFISAAISLTMTAQTKIYESLPLMTIMSANQIHKSLIYVIPSLYWAAIKTINSSYYLQIVIIAHTPTNFQITPAKPPSRRVASRWII